MVLVALIIIELKAINLSAQSANTLYILTINLPMKQSQLIGLLSLLLLNMWDLR